jgi:hypothetical protein
MAYHSSSFIVSSEAATVKRSELGADATHTSVNAKPHVELVTNYKLTAHHAERSGLIWA